MIFRISSSFPLSRQSSRNGNCTGESLSHESSSVYLYTKIYLISYFSDQMDWNQHHFSCNFWFHDFRRNIVYPDFTVTLCYGRSSPTCLTLSWIKIYLVHLLYSPFHPICLATSPTVI